MNATEMRLADEPFEKIKSGEKTVEIRLYDEKRKQIKVGDKIIFYRLNDNTDFKSATVIDLHHYKSFKELFSSELFSMTGCGLMSVDEATQSMYKYYTQEQEKTFGVLGIEIKLCEQGGK